MRTGVVEEVNGPEGVNMPLVGEGIAQDVPGC